MITRRARLVVDPRGDTYRVRITPRETPAGVSERAHSLTFETQHGTWVGALPVYAWVSLDELSDRQLVALLREARHWS